VWSAADRHRIVVGEGLALVGYNDIPLARLLPVPLTSVNTPLAQIAPTAMDLLLDGGTDKAPVKKALPTLMPRQSSGPRC